MLIEGISLEILYLLMTIPVESEQGHGQENVEYIGVAS